MAEQRPASSPPNGNIKRRKQYLASFVVSLGGFSLGVCLGWNSSSSESLKNYVNGGAIELGLVGGIFNLGVCIGLTLVPLVLKGFSRIGAMMLTVPILFLGWSCIVFAGQMVPLLIFGRTLCGFSGTFCVLAPIYIAEISDKNIRGFLLVIFQLMINFGIMFAFALAHFTSDEKTVWLYSLVCTVTTAPVALVILIPESPTYHILMGNEEKAKVSLRYFRGDNYHGLNYEMEDLKTLVAVKESNPVTFATLKDKRVFRSLTTAFALMIMHQLSGISPFIFYTLAIFNAGGSADISSSAQTLVVGFAQIIGCVIAAFLIDVAGRKPLLIASSSLMGVFLVLLGWFFKVEKEDPEYAEKLSWMPLTWMSLFFGAFNLGVGPTAWVYLGEIFPIHVKLEAATTMAILNWLASLSLTLLFGEMLDGIGESNTMWFFAGFCFLGTIFTAVFIKETKRRSFVDIQEETHTLDSTEL